MKHSVRRGIQWKRCQNLAKIRKRSTAIEWETFDFFSLSRRRPWTNICFLLNSFLLLHSTGTDQKKTKQKHVLYSWFPSILLVLILFLLLLLLSSLSTLTCSVSISLSFFSFLLTVSPSSFFLVTFFLSKSRVFLFDCPSFLLLLLLFFFSNRKGQERPRAAGFHGIERENSIKKKRNKKNTRNKKYM